MKKSIMLLFLISAAMAVTGCIRENEMTVQKVPTMTIRASIPEEPLTKASFSVPGSGTGLHLAWGAGDNIRVINGANSAVYDIQAGYTDHEATFSGAVVPGDYFDVIAPGTYASVAAAEAGNASLTQTGNGNTEHLVFTAKLGNVAKADLPDIGFTDAWVAAHTGTTLKRGGIVKFVLTLPVAVTAPKKVVLSGLGDDISVNIASVSLTSEHVLTAYAQCGWDDVDIPAGTDFTVSVMDGDGSVYAATKSVPADATLKAGAQNIITITDGFVAKLFMAGDGSQAHPYLIASAKQLDNMHSVLEHQDKKYFRLMNDVDMQTYLASNAWVPLNMDSPYDYPVNFDGGGHTIDHFSISTTSEANKQTGFFGVLYGEVYDLTFANATVTNTYGLPTGILCGYCGYKGMMTHVYNVHIVNGSVTYESSLSGANGNGPAGGLAGRIHTCLIESCSADVNVSSKKAFAGGLFGIDWESGSIVRNCWTSGSVNAAGQRTGGICGSLIKTGTQIVNCFSTASVIAPRGIGGIVGYANMDQGSGTGYETAYPDYVVSGCIAWQDQLRTSTYNGATSTNNFWSSGAIVSGTSTHNYLSNCWRKASLDFRDYSGQFTLYDQEDASRTTPLVVDNPDPSTFKNYYPYHGKAASAGESLSDVARRIGWNQDVWDLSGDTPVLTGAIQVDNLSSGEQNVPVGSLILDRDFPVNGVNGWTVEEIETGITYYHYYGKPSYMDSGTRQQDVYVIAYDLTNTDFDVKLVYADPVAPCSEIFSETNAIAAINAGYEKGSIALKTNALWDGSDFTEFPTGYPVSYVPNNVITDNNKLQVDNWKSEGTFYTDGHRDVRIAFDGFASGTSANHGANTTTKSVQEERMFYRMCTAGETAFVSSAPMLIDNYTQFGRSFRDRHPKQSNSSEDPYTHQGGTYPRTAVGIAYPDGSTPYLLLVVCDGRYTNGTRGYGMSALWLTRFIGNEFGPKYLLNLDGGGSTTMCVKDHGDEDTHVVNYPCDNYTDGDMVDHAGERARDSFIVIVPAE